ncbi:MAG: hypothetical protein AAF494_01010 [Pseudomonadota bacterium]
MARTGTGYFDRRGNYHKSARDATLSDLAALLGQIGDGESLAPGIAQTIFERRSEIERLYAEHDVMLSQSETDLPGNVANISGKVAQLPNRPST